jgi:hypothetical protein
VTYFYAGGNRDILRIVLVGVIIPKVFGAVWLINFVNLKVVAAKM